MTKADKTKPARGEAAHSFHEEIEAAINRHGIDSMLNTPDFIISEYLMGCIDLLNMTTRDRDIHFGNSKGDGVMLNGATLPKKAGE